MSKDELSRLVQDTISDPVMIQKTMSIKDQPTMETFIATMGYQLTKEEIVEVWDRTSRILGDRSEPMSAAQWRIDTINNVFVTSPK